MKIISLIFALTAFAQPEPNLRFQYVPNEGGEILQCTHKRIRDLPDWEVNCGSKQFVAHVILRHYHRKDHSSMELLYWVTARSEDKRKPPLFHSTTAWIHLKERGEAARISLSQGVENDYASLVMEWRSDN
jgi:hypothetical protein